MASNGAVEGLRIRGIDAARQEQRARVEPQEKAIEQKHLFNKPRDEEPASEGGRYRRTGSPTRRSWLDWEVATRVLVEKR
jgi:hypothetical protein